MLVEPVPSFGADLHRRQPRQDRPHRADRQPAPGCHRCRTDRRSRRQRTRFGFQPAVDAQQTDEYDHQHRHPRRVVVPVQRRRPVLRGDPHQERGAEHVGDHRHPDTARQQNGPARDRQPREFPEEQSRHEHRLQGTDAAARLVDPHHLVPHADEVALLFRRDTQKVHAVGGKARDAALQTLDERLLRAARPRQREQQKPHGEREVPHPRLAAAPRRRQQRKRHEQPGVQPGKQPPVAVGFLDQAHRQQQRETAHCHYEQNRRPRARGRGRRGPVPPAQPPQRQRQRGHKPTVGVLVVDAPIDPQPVPQHQPGREQRSGQPPSARRGRRGGNVADAGIAQGRFRGAKNTRLAPERQGRNPSPRGGALVPDRRGQPLPRRAGYLSPLLGPGLPLESGPPTRHPIPGGRFVPYARRFPTRGSRAVRNRLLASTLAAACLFAVGRLAWGSKPFRRPLPRCPPIHPPPRFPPTPRHPRCRTIPPLPSTIGSPAAPANPLIPVQPPPSANLFPAPALPGGTGALPGGLPAAAPVQNPPAALSVATTTNNIGTARRFQYNVALTLGTTFDDNIFLEASSLKQSDVYFTVQAHHRAGVWRRSGRLRAGQLRPLHLLPGGPALPRSLGNSTPSSSSSPLSGAYHLPRITLTGSAGVQILDNTDVGNPHPYDPTANPTDPTNPQPGVPVSNNPLSNLNLDTGQRTRLNLYSTALDANYYVSDKVSYDVSGQFSDSEYQSQALLSSSTLAGSFFFNYSPTGKTTVGVGTTVRLPLRGRPHAGPEFRARQRAVQLCAQPQAARHRAGGAGTPPIQRPGVAATFHPSSSWTPRIHPSTPPPSVSPGTDRWRPAPCSAARITRSPVSP